MRTRVAIVGALLAAGCTHTYFQRTVSADELRHIEQTTAALGASYESTPALAQVVDLDGRRAVETLLAAMTVQQTNADESYQRLLRALYIGVMGDASDPLAALQSDLTMSGLRVGRRVAGHHLDQFGLGGLAEMAAPLLGEGDSSRLREMQASLQRGEIRTCHQGEVVVSYDAAILGHIDADLANEDPGYLAWRDRVRAVHLVHVTCRARHVLIVMSRNEGEPGLRVIGWHFVTPEQWEAMQPGLRDAFDLPDP